MPNSDPRDRFSYPTLTLISYFISESLPTGTPTPPTTPNPCGTGFKCTAGGCVPQTNVCDFAAQCTDKSDEANCGMYMNP